MSYYGSYYGGLGYGYGGFRGLDYSSSYGYGSGSYGRLGFGCGYRGYGCGSGYGGCGYNSGFGHCGYGCCYPFSYGRYWSSGFY